MDDREVGIELIAKDMASRAIRDVGQHLGGVTGIAGDVSGALKTTRSRLLDLGQKGQLGGFIQDLSHGRSVADSLRASLSGVFGKGAKDVLAGIVGYKLVAGAIRGARDAIFDAKENASALTESLSKSRVVFESSADEIEAWAGTADKAFGQSKQQALEAAGTYGNLFRAFGIGREEAAKMSTSLVQLAADLASFNNTSIDDALLALRSGLSGETEPLKRFGIALNDARLKEEALALGLIKTAKGVLPIAIKSQAAYSLIMKDSTLAQGDFTRTNHELANSERILDAMTENLSASFGQMLIPIWSAAVGLGIALVDNMDTLAPLLAAAAVAITSVLVPALGRMAIAAAGSLGPIGLLISGLAAIGVTLSQTADTLDEKADKIRAALAQEGLFALPDAVKGKLQAELSEIEIEMSAHLARTQAWVTALAGWWWGGLAPRSLSQVEPTTVAATAHLAPSGLRAGSTIRRCCRRRMMKSA